jgi:hypothetical protein
MSYIVNKLVIADIERASLSKEVRDALSGHIIWRDQRLNEHIYSVEEFLEELHHTFSLVSKESIKVIAEIQEELKESDASYIRLIN